MEVSLELRERREREKIFYDEKRGEKHNKIIFFYITCH